jgi:membrane peptidoglycan carboxypeptidase
VILAAALDQGAKTQQGQPITADTIYDGTSRRHVVGSDVAFAPPNEDGVSYGPVTVQKAMNKSINSVFAQMGVDVGMDRVMHTAGALGMDVDGLPVVPAQTLGSMSASPMEMAGVYATLDHHGQKVTPQIVKTAAHEGVPVELPEAIGGQAISRQAADSVTSVLTGVVNDGTGSAVRNPEQAVAGKTGTSDENKSAWFSGYTPKLVTSVGLFGEAANDRKADDGKVIKRGTHVSMRGAGGLPRVDGASFPARIWAAYTFKVMGAPSDFDLDTDMGAAVSPPPAPTTSAPSESPSDTPSTSTSPPAPTTQPPGTGTAPPPTGGPTPPTTPPTTPSVPPGPTTSAPPYPESRTFGNQRTG